jgi:hypothetical protein
MILFAIAGVCVGSEYFMSNNSRWNLMAKKFGNPSTPPRGWQGCKFLRVEIQEGNRLRLTTYGHGYKKDALDILAAKLFPKVLVSVGPLGLYLKRQPWNFRHPQILIPWSHVTSAQSVSMSEFATQAAARRLPIPGLQFPKVPGVLEGVVNAPGGRGRGSPLVGSQHADPVACRSGWRYHAIPEAQTERTCEAAIRPCRSGVKPQLLNRWMPIPQPSVVGTASRS